MKIPIMTAEEAETVDAVICMRVSALPVPHVPSDKANCKICGQEVWVSKLSPKTPPRFCVPCGMEMMGATKQ